MSIPVGAVNTLKQTIQQQHIEILKRGGSIMISDYEKINPDSTLNIIETKPLIFVPVPIEAIRKEWIWRFDTKMTHHSDCLTQYKVIAAKF